MPRRFDKRCFGTGEFVSMQTLSRFDTTVAFPTVHGIVYTKCLHSNDFTLYRNSFYQNDFVTKRLNSGFSEILELISKPVQEEALLHFISREDMFAVPPELGTANL